MMELLLSMIIVTVIISVLFKLLVYHYKRLDLYKAGNKIPGPWPVLPIFGNALFFCSIDKVISKIVLSENFKFSPVRLWLGNKLLIAVFDPEQLKTVCHSPKVIEKSKLYNILHPYVGTGLITAPANKWKVNRKLIVPTFHPRILESFVGVMNEQSEILTKVLEPEVNKDEFDIFPYMSRCTLDIICEATMGVSLGVQTNRDSTFVKTLARLKEIFGLRMLKVWYHPDLIFKFTKLAREQEECINYLHNYTNNVIERKRQKFNEIISGENDVTQANRSQRKIFLDLLMELSNEGTKFTNEQLREEVDTMMVAGNDTSAIVNSFILYILASYPEVQEKCYEELVGIFGDQINNGKQIENEDLSHMKYLERVIKETMRLFPPVPLAIREVSEDLEIGGGYTLPKGCNVVLTILKLHRSADFWDDPLSFNPDRFLPEQVALRHPYTYVPFSAGSRNCIGSKYAMMSMKIVLASLIRNYVFIKDNHVKVEDIQITTEIFTKSLKPLTVKIKRRCNTII